MTGIYVLILAVFLLFFLVSRREDITNVSEEKAKYPGEKYFLRLSVYLLRLFKYKGGNGQLGKTLHLLSPSQPEKQQVRTFQTNRLAMALLIVFVGDMLALCLTLSTSTSGILGSDNRIARNGYGESGLEVSLSAQVEGEEETELSYTIASRKYTEAEIEALYEEASALLPEKILGENTDAENVTVSLHLPTSLDGYPFTISWESDNYSLVNTDGEVHNADLEEPTVVTLNARFKYEGSIWEDALFVQICPAVYTGEELLMQQIQASLAEQDAGSSTEESMQLPTEIDGKKVVWKEVVSDSSMYLFLLVCLAAVCIFYAKGKDADKLLEKRNQELLLDYPEIVNKLILYMGAGMTIRGSFQKMGEDYKKQKTAAEKRYAYEEILLLCHEIQSGVSEADAYADFGKRCQVASYRRLSSLLSQNLRMGSADLFRLLRQEEDNAFTDRKNTARKLGEEAGTKLLMPMMMMLCIVMVIIIVPAFMSFSV